MRFNQAFSLDRQAALVKYRIYRKDYPPAPSNLSLCGEIVTSESNSSKQLSCSCNLHGWAYISALICFERAGVRQLWLLLAWGYGFGWDKWTNEPEHFFFVPRGRLTSSSHHLKIRRRASSLFERPAGFLVAGWLTGWLGSRANLRGHFVFCRSFRIRVAVLETHIVMLQLDDSQKECCASVDTHFPRMIELSMAFLGMSEPS